MIDSKNWYCAWLTTIVESVAVKCWIDSSKSRYVVQCTWDHVKRHYVRWELSSSSPGPGRAVHMRSCQETLCKMRIVKLRSRYSSPHEIMSRDIMWDDNCQAQVQVQVKQCTWDHVRRHYVRWQLSSSGPGPGRAVYMRSGQETLCEMAIVKLQSRSR